MKEHKTQILAALALAFALGAVAPSAVFASEGTEGDAGIEAQAEGTTGGGTNSDKEELSVVDSIAELYNRIQTREVFAGYRNSLALIENTIAINASDLLEDATQWAKDTECYSASGVVGTLMTWIESGTKTGIAGKKVYQAIDLLKADKQYTENSGYKTIVDNLQTEYTTLQATEIAQIKVVMPSVSGVDTMDFMAMVNMVEKSSDYNKNLALYDTTSFLKSATADGVVSPEALKTLYSEADLAKNYNAMALAARAIDATALEGLSTAWKLPDTSAGEDDKKPNTPNTGIIGLFEAGALDLGTLTLIVSVGLASAAGLALIAKLYLKHKF